MICSGRKCSLDHLCVSATVGAAVALVMELDIIRTKSLDPGKRGLLKAYSL